MPDHATHWVRIVGDGQVYDGPCVVKAIVFWPHSNNQYADIYDGRDTTSGTKFCRIIAYRKTTLPVNFGQGVLFGRGIYVDGEHEEDETTVTFTPI